MKEFIAVDLGASNGRTILGHFDGRSIKLEEINRFENSYVRVGDAYYWNVLSLYSNIIEGLSRYAKGNGTLSGIGIDTWGVDFGFIDRQGRIVGNPRSYRDPRGRRGMEAFHKKHGDRKLFELTGISSAEYNTIYQLYDMAQTGDPQFAAADKMLMMPDLLGYMLCGQVSTEYTEATTTQMLDRTGNWSPQILSMAGIPETMMSPLQMSGTEKGRLHEFIRQDTGLAGTPVVYNIGSHDTASAVASVPAALDNYAFISSGTWSLVGAVSRDAIVSDEVYNGGLSNEGTVDGGYRLLKNIMGMWIIQNCKKLWDREHKTSWDDIMGLAEKAAPFRSFIDVNAHVFFDGNDMVRKIQGFCADTGQPVPESKGEIARTIYESLAMSYRETVSLLERLKGQSIETLHIVGGGSKDSMLNQMSASAIGREVIAGPSEATSIGNLMMQVMASGEVKGFGEMREVIRGSFSVKSYEPKDTEEWTEQFERYVRIKEKYGSV